MRPIPLHTRTNSRQVARLPTGGAGYPAPSTTVSKTNMTKSKAVRRAKSDSPNGSYMDTVISFYDRQTRLAIEEGNLNAAGMFELGMLAIVICDQLGVDIERSAKSPILRKSVRAIVKSTESTIQKRSPKHRQTRRASKTRIP
jgi:hypothetical protein